jgi:LEA14-like dessication related protein
MSKLMNHHLRRGTQTGLSASFCVRGAALTLQAALAFLIAVVLPAQTRALEDRKPAVHLKGVSIRTVDWKARTAATEFSIAIDTPGPAFKVKDLSYRFKLNDKQAAQGKYDKTIEVPAGSSATFKLPCSVDLSALPGVAWAVVAGGFDVHYELETEFTVPIFASVNPRITTSIGGDLSLGQSIAGWTTRIKERIENPR